MSRIITLLLLLSTAGCNLAEYRSSYLEQTRRVDNFLIGPQFAAEDIAELTELGVSAVINSRHPDEMKELKFDQARSLEQAGMTYLTAPLGGKEYPMSPATLDRFSSAIKAAGSDGPVLLHCRSGRRSSLLLAAYLVREKGMTEEAAAEAVGQPELEKADIQKLLK
ncbi:MAG: sulfur transferase domain-containing protein [Xanthomonadales bacterium]|nr:sulfur transferase domain-containing protein [Xanthomonadales bacterium]